MDSGSSRSASLPLAPFLLATRYGYTARPDVARRLVVGDRTCEQSKPAFSFFNFARPLAALGLPACHAEADVNRVPQ